MSLDWLSEILPGKWPSRMLIATAALIGVAFGSPSLLPASFLPSSPEQIFLLRVWLAGIVAVVGAEVVLAVLASHSKELNGRHSVVVLTWASIIMAAISLAIPPFLQSPIVPFLTEPSFINPILGCGVSFVFTCIAILIVSARVREQEAQSNKSFWER